MQLKRRWRVFERAAHRPAGPQPRRVRRCVPSRLGAGHVRSATDALRPLEVAKAGFERVVQRTVPVRLALLNKRTDCSERYLSEEASWIALFRQQMTPSSKTTSSSSSGSSGSAEDKRSPLRSIDIPTKIGALELPAAENR